MNILFPDLPNNYQFRLAMSVAASIRADIVPLEPALPDRAAEAAGSDRRCRRGADLRFEVARAYLGVVDLSEADRRP